MVWSVTQITNQSLQHIDDCIEVGRGLNLSSEIFEIISNKPNDIKRKNAVLWTWKRKKENDATYIELVKSFIYHHNIKIIFFSNLVFHRKYKGDGE